MTHRWPELWALIGGFALGMLLCGTVGHAGERPLTMCSDYWLDADGMVRCDPPTLISGEEEPDPCLATMETAMRSVESYLNTFLSHEQLKITGLVFTPYGLQEFTHTMDAWNETADRCWKKETR